jgi:hypothetical protein
MPPKKKTNNPTGEIVNMYDRIPKEFLDNYPNPNFHLHNFKTPFRAVIVAPSGSGKTNFLLNLLEKFCSGKNGTFSKINIISRNKSEPLYKWLENECDQIVISEGLSSMPKLDDYDKDKQALLVFDDLVLQKDLSIVESVYIRGRKLGVSVIFISQSFFKIPKIIRNNCSYMILLKLSGNREVNIILSEFGLGVTKEQLLALYEFATKEKFSPLIIDMEESPDKKFRKGFTSILDVNHLAIS